MRNRYKILRLQNVEKKLCKRSISNIDKIIELPDKWLKKVKRILQQIFRNVAEKMLQSACSKACSIRIIDTFIRRHVSIDWITRFNGISGGNVRIRSKKRKMQRKRERERFLSAWIFNRLPVWFRKLWTTTRLLAETFSTPMLITTCERIHGCVLDSPGHRTISRVGEEKPRSHRYDLTTSLSFFLVAI